MTEIDPELRDKIIETHTDMKHVRRKIEHHDDDIEELRNQHDKRLRDLEKNQSKIMTYIVVIGSGIALGMKALFALWDKIWK